MTAVFLFNSINWEVCSTNLLCNTTSFTSLNVSLTDFVQQFGFTGIDMSQNTTNWRTQIFSDGEAAFFCAANCLDFSSSCAFLAASSLAFLADSSLAFLAASSLAFFSCSSSTIVSSSSPTSSSSSSASLLLHRLHQQVQLPNHQQLEHRHPMPSFPNRLSKLHLRHRLS